MVRIGPMASPEFPLDRRELMAGLGAAALAPMLPWQAGPNGISRPALAGTAGQARQPCPPPGTARPRRSGRCKGLNSRFKRGETLDSRLRQRAAGAGRPQLAGDRWRPGGRTAAGRPPLAAGGKEAVATAAAPRRHLPLRLGLLGDGQAQPSRARPLIVRESEPVAVDRDEVLLIEDWRVRPDGTAIAPGIDPGDAVPVHTINGQTSLDLSARTNERVRLRIINGCQRSVIAIKMEGSRFA